MTHLSPAYRRFNLRDSGHQFDKHPRSNQYLHRQHQLELPIGKPPHFLVIQLVFLCRCRRANTNAPRYLDTLLTDNERTEFQLVGNSKAVANMSIGQVTLDPIKVNVTTGLWGLKGLKNGLTLIESVDVTGGTTEAIQLGIDVGIYNPSSLELATGDLSLQLYREAALLGTTLLPNLTLNLGNNTPIASADFSPNNSPLGMQTLNDFVGGNDTALTIAGYSSSSNVASLLQAFESLNISVVLPGLKTQLLSSAALTGM